jgi:RNA polymerase sigma-70 factor, ECF subfamily
LHAVVAEAVPRRQLVVGRKESLSAGNRPLWENAMKPEQYEQLAAQWTAAQQTIAVYVEGMVPDFHESEEVLQKVAMALVRKYDQYDPSQPFLFWAIQFAKLEALAHLRHLGMEKGKLVFCDDELLEKLAESCLQTEPDAPVYAEVLKECVEQLDGRCHHAIQLRYADNLKSAQIAAEMKISDRAVRTLLSRARTLLRNCIETRSAVWRAQT